MNAVRKRIGARLAIFPPLVWTMLVGTLLMRTAFFMVWPFLAIILKDEFQLTPSQIGTILSTAFCSSAFAGFYAGHVSDRFGRQSVMHVGCGGAIAAYMLLAVAPSVAWYTVGAFLVGFSRSVLEVPTRAVIADCLADQHRRDLAFHVRYFLINVGGAVGPVLGLVFGLAARQQTFWLTVAAYATFAMAAALAFRRHPEGPHLRSARSTTVSGAIRVLAADRAFLLLVLAMVMIMFAYAQQESTLIQYVSAEAGTDAVPLVTALLVTNALTVVCFQFPLLRATAALDPFVRSYTGLAAFALAFALYPLLPVSSVGLWIGVTWLLSVGEAVLFPTLQLQIDRLAPAHLKGSYFGAAGLSSIGFGLGPVAGGLMLQHGGGPLTFLLTSAAVIAAGFCCRMARREAAATR
jgi:MFS family permease